MRLDDSLIVVNVYILLGVIKLQYEQVEHDR